MEHERGWRVGHTGRDQMYYEERVDGTWHRIVIDGEMLTGRAHHVIYFAAPAQWRQYPEWARGRRDVIIARVMSEFRAPDYEHDGVDGEVAPAGSAPPAPIDHASVSPRQPRGGMPAEQRHALLLAIGLVSLLGAGGGVLAVRGVAAGRTVWPGARPSQQRAVERAIEPASYWLAIGLYATVGVLGGGLAFRGLVELRRDVAG